MIVLLQQKLEIFPREPRAPSTHPPRLGKPLLQTAAPRCFGRFGAVWGDGLLVEIAFHKHLVPGARRLQSFCPCQDEFICDVEEDGRPVIFKQIELHDQNSAWRGVRGKGITSRMFSIPVRSMIRRSKPSPKPAWGQLPQRRLSRYQDNWDLLIPNSSMRFSR